MPDNHHIQKSVADLVQDSIALIHNFFLEATRSRQSSVNLQATSSRQLRQSQERPRFRQSQASRAGAKQGVAARQVVNCQLVQGHLQAAHQARLAPLQVLGSHCLQQNPLLLLQQCPLPNSRHCNLQQLRLSAPGLPYTLMKQVRVMLINI